MTDPADCQELMVGKEAPAARLAPAEGGAAPAGVPPVAPAGGRPRSRPVPGWRLAAVVGTAAVVGALLPVPAPWGVLLALAVVVGVAAADWASAPRPALVRVVRSMPSSLALGEEGEVSWSVTNPAARVAHVSVADELPPSLRAGRRRFALRLPPAATLRATTNIRPARRGDVTPSEVVVRAEGRWRLVARQAARQDPARLRVLPPFRSRQQAELRIARARILEVGMRSAQARGGGTDFDQLRAYAVDDDSRRIDWAATARAAQTIVRTYRAERNQRVVVLLDAGRTMAGRVEGVPRLEHAMDAAMMLTAVATRLGDRAGVVAFGRRVRAVVPPAAGRHQLGRVVDAIYRLEPELAESDYRAAFAETLARFRRRALVVVLSELAEQALDEGLLRDLPLLARTHLVLVGSMRDPAVEAWAASMPVSAGDAYRQAAAVAALRQRRRSATRLAARGAIVVDAGPGRLAPRLADAYLRVKATGRL